MCQGQPCLEGPSQQMRPRSFVMLLTVVSPNHAVWGPVLPRKPETAQHGLLEGLVYPKLNKATQQHCHFGTATKTRPGGPVPKGRRWQIRGHGTHLVQRRNVSTEAGGSTYRGQTWDPASVQREVVISGPPHLSHRPTAGHYHQRGQTSGP